MVVNSIFVDRKIPLSASQDVNNTHITNSPVLLYNITPPELIRGRVDVSN